MKIFKNLFVYFCLFVFASTNAFCVVNSKTVDYVANEKNVRTLGRTYFENDILWAIYSSSGVEFNIKAKRLDVAIKGDSYAKVSSAKGQTNLARMVVFVNGERKLDELILKQDQTFTVFDQKDEIEGVVQIIKISEVSSSVAGIKSISVDKKGKIWPTEAKTRRIEFIGDSITCGYGIDDENRNHHFSTATEDNTKTYAYKTAAALKADYSMVSISGWGIISGYTSNPNQKSSGQLIPKYYDKLGFCYNTFDGKIAQEIDWDFNKFKSDVVVINLGTNDSSYCGSSSNKRLEFRQGYKDFIKLVREKNPEAHILCVLGLMGSDLFGEINAAVNEIKTETNDKKVSALRLNNQRESDGIAADWHPTERTNKKAATTVILEIKKLMGW